MGSKPPITLIADFNTKAAVELATMSIDVRKKAGTRRGGAGGTWAKITFDRQIAAIAIIHNASTIYSDDGDLEKLGKQHGISVVRTWELPLPKAKQAPLPFEPPTSTPTPKKPRSK